MGKAILIIDDEEELVATLEGFLRMKGFETFTASTGGEGLKILEGEELDMVLLDVNLPNMDGEEVLRSIREKYPEMKVIGTTGYVDKHKETFEEIGVDGFITKPVSLRALMDKIEEVLRS